MGRCLGRASNCPVTLYKRYKFTKPGRRGCIQIWVLEDSNTSRWMLYPSCLWFCLQAKDELNETDERRASSLKDLRVTMKDRAAEGEDLAKMVLERFGDKPDSVLLRFLRARKFDVVRAHELMKGEWHIYMIYRQKYTVRHRKDI